VIRNGLEKLIEEAIDFGFNTIEVDFVRRCYYDALIKYDDAHKDNYPRGIQASINYEEVRQMTAYAVTKSYIRKSIDMINKGK
jgi:hypothetical protein